MGMLKDTFDILSKFWDGVRETNEEERNRFKTELVEPSFELMKIVHKDYMRSFTQLKSTYEKREVPRIEIIDWLRKQSAEYSEERHRIYAVMNNPDLHKNYFNETFQYTEEIVLHFNVYCDAIREYFDSSFGISDMSWYSSSLDHLESIVKRVNESLSDTSIELRPKDFDLLVIGTHPNKLLQSRYESPIYRFPDNDASDEVTPEMIDNILSTLPKRYEFLVTCYNRLIASC